MQVKVSTKVKTKVIDFASGQVLRESPWRENLLLDNGLNSLAKSTNPTSPNSISIACRIGDGTTPNSYASGAITFTQSTNVITASGGFFTVAMVGMIFKWGTGSGGVETYITGYTSSTQVTVDTSATVGATVATVWAVNQTALTNLLYTTTTYDATAGSNQTTVTGSDVTHQRVYNFPTQAAPYNVNEIGYWLSSAGGTVAGRLVLGATDVVPPTSFYQVTLSITFSFTPNVPTAVANVGTAIDTSGNAMLESVTANFMGTVNANGSANSGQAMDNACRFYLLIASYSQNGTAGTALTVSQLLVGTSLTWTYAGSRGKCSIYSNTGIATTGQTLYGVALCDATLAKVYFDVKLTTPFTLPTGTFLPQTTFAITYNRTLTN